MPKGNKGKDEKFSDYEKTKQATKGSKQEVEDDQEALYQSGDKRAVKDESDEEEQTKKNRTRIRNKSDKYEDSNSTLQEKEYKKTNKREESNEGEPKLTEKQQKKGDKKEVLGEDEPKKGRKQKKIINDIQDPEEDKNGSKKGVKQQKKNHDKKQESDDEKSATKGGNQTKKANKKELDEDQQKKKQNKKGNRRDESNEDELTVKGGKDYDEPKKSGKHIKKGNKRGESDGEERKQLFSTSKVGKQLNKKSQKSEENEEDEESEESEGSDESEESEESKDSEDEDGDKNKLKEAKMVEEEEQQVEEKPRKTKKIPKRGKEVKSEETKKPSKGGAKLQQNRASQDKKLKEEAEEELNTVVAEIVSKRSKKNRRKGGRTEDSDDEMEVGSGFAGLSMEDKDAKPKGKDNEQSKSGRIIGGGFGELRVDESEEENSNQKAKKNNKKQTKIVGGGGFVGLYIEDEAEQATSLKKNKKQKKQTKLASDDEAAQTNGKEEENKAMEKGVAAMSIKDEKDHKPKESKMGKSVDDTRSRKAIRQMKKDAARQSEAPKEEVNRERTTEEVDKEAEERYNLAQQMKGREPPNYVHLRNSEEKRSKLGNDVKVDNYTLQVPGRTLLADASFTLAFGHRYGFVGRNGLGKSSLLQKIAERDGIQIASHLRVLYVEQEVPGDDTLPIDYVLKADAEREWLVSEERILQSMEIDDPYWMDNPDEKRCYGLREIQERMREIESEKAVPRASAILVGLGFDADEIKMKPSREFSGGWRMRISLARALFCRPDVLLLDEPTNHLDLHACFWLERYLSKWKSTLMVVSHEATFLNEIVDHILEIRNKKLTTFRGDYWSYTKTRELHDTTEKKKHDLKTKEIDKLREQVQRTRATKGGASGASTRLDKIMGETTILERDDPSLKVSFPEPDTLPPPMVQFQDVSFGYDASSKPLFKTLEFGIDMESRIALVGLNGVGKSTLMKLMAGELKESTGYISRNRKARIARFSQHSLEQLNPELTPIQYLDAKFGVGSEAKLRQHLGRFGITGNLALNKIDILSGGQKSRVVLAELAWAEPHILFLDEPSNHLDLDAIEALAQGLNAFTGGVVLISHNQRLISLVCSEIWVVTKAGTVDRFNGEFEEYKDEILAHMDFAGIEEEEADEEQERLKEKENRKAKKIEKAEREDLKGNSKKEKKDKKGKK